MCRGTIHAHHKMYAQALLIQQGIIVKKIRRAPTIPLRERLSQRLNASNVNHADITQLLLQLALLLRAGITLLDSLIALTCQQHKRALQQLLKQLQQQIEQGQSFSAILNDHTRYFDSLTCRLIAGGEQSGNLEQMLHRAAAYRQRSEILKQRIKAACLYPVIVLILATLVTLTLLMVVIPQFRQLFADNHIPLPPLTQHIINLSQQLHAHYRLVIILSGLLLLTIKIGKKRSRHINQWLDSVFLRLPIIGTIINKRISIRCLETLALTFSAGMPLLDCLTISANVANHHRFYQAWITVKNNVSKGQTLHQAMQHTPLFSPLAIEMIACGEKSGQLDTLIIQLTTLYRQQIDRFVDNLNTLLEPFIMVTLGGIIGIILVAIYLPIFQLGKVI